MGYRSEVGIRCAIKPEGLVHFYNKLIVAAEKDHGYEDDLQIAKLPYETFDDINNIVDTFYNLLADTPLYDIIEDIKTILDEDHQDFIVIEYHSDWIKWYDDFPWVQFWETICSDEYDYVLEWSFVRVGEDYQDVECRDNCDYTYIEPLFPTTTIDWGN